MLLDENGFKISAFDPILAEVLGAKKGEEGANVLAEAMIRGRAQVQFRDWLFCLAKSPITLVRKRLMDAPGQTPKRFVDSIEDGIDDFDEPKGFPPESLSSATVASPALRMLERAEELTCDYDLPNINDHVLTTALFDCADEELISLLRLWTKEEGLKAFITRVRSELDEMGPGGSRLQKELFDGDGSLNGKLLSPSARKFCQRMSEDAASLGVKKITTRHMLYSLLGKESGLLSVGLTMRGVDVKRQLHATLARELAQPGRKRNDEFELVKDAMFDGVAATLKHSIALASERGATTFAEFDIARAFVKKHGSEINRLFPPSNPLDIGGLLSFLDTSDPADDEEDAKAAQKFTIKEIHENMSKRVLGQDVAIARVIPWVKRLRFGLPRDGRPAAVFLFLGPTGTGKTQLSKELARYVYGDQDMMIFLEMGQFQSKESMNMFIGAPPGYVGYGDGKLTNGLGEKPECVVLFDEIEKAEIQVFDALLRFADEGMISDPAGPVRDGRKCIIVMTTNAGQTWLRSYLQANPNGRDDPEALSEQLFREAMNEMQAKGFRPEFLGRVDERISFLPFTLQVCRQIVDSVLDKEIKKIRKLKGVMIEVTDKARQFMADKAFVRSLDEGARGAPRAVNEFIVTPVIDILSEELAHGVEAPSHLLADVKGLDQVVLEVIK